MAGMILSSESAQPEESMWSLPIPVQLAIKALQRGVVNLASAALPIHEPHGDFYCRG